MGGRGGTSGIGGVGLSGLDVTKDGETTRYYFSKSNGRNYYQRSIGGTPEPTPLNMSPNEFKRRVESNGATTKTVSDSDKRRDQARYKEDRRKTNDFLNKANTSTEARKGTRADRISRNFRGGR